MHVDDLTLVTAEQILGSDNLYLGRPSDTADPDKRTNVEELTERLVGPDGALPVAAGTWLPELGASGSNPTVDYADQSGVWNRVGNLVTISGVIATSARTGGSGSLVIRNLPFAPRASMTVTIMPRFLTFSGASVVGFVSVGGTFMTIYQFSSGSNYSQVQIGSWASNGALYFSAAYATTDA